MISQEEFISMAKNSFDGEIFIPNTLKLSYCCMKNISNIIKQHNATVLAISTANVYATVETKIPTPLMGVA